jgi:GT2 family glycosyltransferase
MHTVELSPAPTCILVLGVHRSGTSALTRCLNLVGMDLGSHLLSPAEMNAKGFWEHADAVRINDQLLEAFGLLWYDLKTLPDEWLASAAADAAREEIRLIVKRDFNGVPLWGIKDPRLCRLAPLWIEVLQEMGVRVESVFMTRSPLEVAESLSRFPDYRLHSPLSIPHGVLLWAQDLAEAVVAAQSIPRVMVDYEHLLSDPVAVVSKIGEGLGLMWPISLAERSQSLLAFMDVGMRTHRKDVSAGHVPLLVAELAHACASFGADASAASWSALIEVSRRVLEQLKTVSYVGTPAGFGSSGDERLQEQFMNWVPNAALYYATQDDPAFSEDRCVLAAVPWGRNQLDLRLPAGAGAPVRLRFDPLDRRGAYVLHSLICIDRVGQVAWDWSGTGDGVGLTGVNLMPSLTGGGQLVAYTDEDPQLSIELPQSVAERCITIVRVDIECLDAGALSKEVTAQIARADFESARALGHEEMFRGRIEAFAEEHRRQAEAYSEEHRRQAEAYAEEHRRQAEAYAEEHRRQAQAYAEESRQERQAYEQALEAERVSAKLRADQLAEQFRSSSEVSRWKIEHLTTIQLTQARELQAVYESTMWRMMVRFRGVMSHVPVGVRSQMRRVLKAAWWCVTPWKMPARIRFLRERRAAQARERAGTASSASASPPTSVVPSAVISFMPSTDATNDAISGRYHLGGGEVRYTYIPPRPPANLAEELAVWVGAPRFSIVVPVYNTPAGLLNKLVDSVLAQWYPHWELILVNDNSLLDHVAIDLGRLSDPRIAVIHLTENRRIALATNEGVARASGEFIVFADHDDELTPDCLYELARCVERENPDFIYSDEDKLDERGQFVQPFFKPDWSPDTMMSTMYTCHASCVRRELVNEVGGLRADYDGCQDWDLILRVVERTDRIAHIPKVLYHWRILPASVASGFEAKPHVIAASKRAREDAMARRGLTGSMEPVEEIPGYFRAAYKLQGDPLMSIVIATKDNHRALKRCVDSIESKSTYRNFEILVLDHGSSEPATAQYVASLRGSKQVRLISHDGASGAAALKNAGLASARGDLVLFLADSMEVTVPDWLERLGGFAQLSHVGAVGAKLLYPDSGLVQHAGYVNLSSGPSHGFHGLQTHDHGYFARAVLEYNWLAVSGACLMVARSKLEKVGGFDEAFSTAGEDVDLCLRFVEAGLFNVVTPAVRLVNHDALADDGCEAKYGLGTRETELLYQKHPKFYKFDPFHNLNLAPDNARFGLPQ